MKKNKFTNILVTGGAGYVGALLVPKLLDKGFNVTVIDLFIFNENVFDNIENSKRLKLVKGDIRNYKLLKETIPGHHAVIHLACISNDPSFELDPELGRSINYDAFLPLLETCRKQGVKRFIYASSSSVYGIKNEENVTEDLSLEPLTDYSKYKALCEEILLKDRSDDLSGVIIRPATICGYSPRLRLDLTVNLLTNLGYNRREITVFGGEQKRPNIHIEDITDLYLRLLEYPDEKVAYKIFNAGYENQKIIDIANIVKKEAEKELKKEVKISVSATDDLRSYHISSEKIKRELGFVPKYTIENAVRELIKYFRSGKISDPINNPCYYNVKMLKQKKIKMLYENI